MPCTVLNCWRARAFDTSRARNAVVGLVSVSSPVALVSAGVGIEDDDAPVAVAIRHEDFVGFRIHANSRRPIQVFGVVTAAGFSVVADLEEKLAGLRELQDVGVLFGVAAHPDVVFVVDEHAVFVVGPLVTLARAAPSLNEVARLHRIR